MSSSAVPGTTVAVNFAYPSTHSPFETFLDDAVATEVPNVQGKFDPISVFKKLLRADVRLKFENYHLIDQIKFMEEERKWAVRRPLGNDGQAYDINKRMLHIFTLSEKQKPVTSEPSNNSGSSTTASAAAAAVVTTVQAQRNEPMQATSRKICTHYNRGNCKEDKDNRGYCINKDGHSYQHICWYCRDESDTRHPNSECVVRPASPALYGIQLGVHSCDKCFMNFKDLLTKQTHDEGNVHKSRITRLSNDATKEINNKNVTSYDSIGEIKIITSFDTAQLLLDVARMSQNDKQ